MENKHNYNAPTMAELAQKGVDPEVLLWIGCAGSYDERYKKVTLAFVKILNIAEVSFAVLGQEEACTGDPARRAGNEFLFQMQAAANIQVLNGYNIKKIVTACPHCYNTIKNEYPDLGGTYEVVHHSEFLNQLIQEGRLKINDNDIFKNTKITYHDSCYLGRSNQIYDAPRQLIESLQADLVEMERHKQNGFCCGAGGAQMFKEPENGNKDINIERTEEALQTNATIIASACPFCMTMLSDGIKNKEREEDVKVLDLAELIAKSKNL
ncbi:MAG: (Fe-S)-binding protein [Cyclobacteriaceae bacterium]|nr:(Fe-S)-binding protein [Cyclobacteriaceae bacterium]MCK5371855.1 (Fe-S)-binding protein [Cyclobacteriaceae bacterium]MCK5467870.1 (Fe-S)-binding protein [Cyclobacteriaceae bacterium]